MPGALPMRPAIRLIAALVLAAAASHAHVVGGPQRGLGLAQEACSECHAVQRGQARSPNSGAPTFVELATSPGITILS
jgi:mono/diheme cytochrome c family protein